MPGVEDHTRDIIRGKRVMRAGDGKDDERPAHLLDFVHEAAAKVIWTIVIPHPVNPADAAVAVTRPGEPGSLSTISMRFELIVNVCGGVESTACTVHASRLRMCSSTAFFSSPMSTGLARNVFVPLNTSWPWASRLHSPPLRDRRDDIARLVRYFANKCARRMEKRIENISRKTMEALCRHSWPGNIRELQNLMERAVLRSSGPALRVPLTDISNVIDLRSASDDSALEQMERELILRALRESNWVVGGTRGAAARLRLNRTGLAYKMKKFGISRPTQ